MKLDTLWQSHRRFLVGVVVGLVVFLLGEVVIGAVAGDGVVTATRRIRAARGKLARAAYGSSAVTALRRRLEEVDERNRELAGLVLPPWRKEFRPPPGRSLRQHYIEFTAARRQELESLALLRDVEVDPSFGLPLVSPTESRDLERALRGFDVVDRVVHLAVAAGARVVDDVEISTRPVRTRLRGLPAPAVEVTPVTLSVWLPEERTETFLRALLGAEPPLGLVRLDLGPVEARRKARPVALEFAVGRLPEEEERP